jgi:hypothetical protein
MGLRRTGSAPFCASRHLAFPTAVEMWPSGDLLDDPRTPAARLTDDAVRQARQLNRHRAGRLAAAQSRREPPTGTLDHRIETVPDGESALDDIGAAQRASVIGPATRERPEIDLVTRSTRNSGHLSLPARLAAWLDVRRRRTAREDHGDSGAIVANG